MPGRIYNSDKYRYSINGQEKDSELNENITTALYWEYDSRIGRRWNVDPVPDISQSPYAVFDNNPIAVTDADGDCTDCPDDPVKSKYLDWIGADFGSFGNGVTDGFIGSLTGIFEFAWDMITDSDAREDFVTGMKAIISDPIGTIKAVAASKYETWSNVLNGNGTEQEKYDVGNDMGTFFGGLVAGAGMKKLVEVVKIAKAEKAMVRAAEAADEATGAGKATVRGSQIHSKFEKALKAEGKNAEVSYKDKKVVRRGEKGSIRADAVYGKNPKNPKIAYDLKTGKKRMTKSEVVAYKKNLPKGTKLKEISKDASGKYKVKKLKAF